MNRKHVLAVALALGLAAAAAAFAVVKTTTHGQTAARASAAQITQRTRQLDRFEASLRRQLAQQPPRIAPLAEAPAVPAAGAPAAAERVVYVRPAPQVVTTHRSGGDDEGYEHEHEHEGEHEHEEGGGADD